MGQNFAKYKTLSVLGLCLRLCDTTGTGKSEFFSNKFTCALTHVHHKALGFGRKMLVYENQAPTIRR